MPTHLEAKVRTVQRSEYNSSIINASIFLRYRLEANLVIVASCSVLVLNLGSRAGAICAVYGSCEDLEVTLPTCSANRVHV